MAQANNEGPRAAHRRVDGTLLAVLVGAATGWLAAGYGGVTGPDVLGVTLGAAVLLGGLLAVPALLT